VTGPPSDAPPGHLLPGSLVRWLAQGEPGAADARVAWVLIAYVLARSGQASALRAVTPPEP
jgi:hypothetical protein